MKKICFFLFAVCLFAGCKSKLDEIGFTDNPYDSDYNGDAVVRTDSVARVRISTVPLIYVNRIYMTSLIEMYDDVIIYRNGIILKTIDRRGHGNVLIELFDDKTAVPGTTYVYSAALKYDTGISQQSAAVSFATPF